MKGAKDPNFDLTCWCPLLQLFLKFLIDHKSVGSVLGGTKSVFGIDDGPLQYLLDLTNVSNTNRFVFFKSTRIEAVDRVVADGAVEVDIPGGVAQRVKARPAAASIYDSR